jgi:hypothetical protein
MQKDNSLKIWLEAIWWVATAVLAVAVLWPIWQAGAFWPFQTWNVIFVVALVTMARYIFLLRHTFLAKRQVLKIVLFLLMFPLTFVFIDGLNGFMTFVEERTWAPLTGHLRAIERPAIEAYIWGEMLFFAVGAVLTSVLFAIRMLLSVWRTRNRGTV